MGAVQNENQGELVTWSCICQGLMALTCSGSKKPRCWPHRVGKIEHTAVVKDRTPSVIRRKGAGKANEGKGQALTQEHSSLRPLLRTWVAFVATRATCQRGEGTEIIPLPPPFSWEGKTPHWSSLLPGEGMNKHLFFMWFGPTACCACK